MHSFIVRIRRHWKRAVIIIVAPVAVALILLESSSFQQFLLRRVSNFAGAAGYDFTAREMDLNIWDLQLTLDGARYNDRKGIIVTADRLILDIPWNAFDADVWIVNQLEIDGLRIGIGSEEPLVPEPSGETTRLPRVRFDRLIVRNGSLVYVNQATRLDLPEFSLEVAGNQGVLRVPQTLTLQPGTRFDIREIPLRLNDSSLQFGPSQWALQYAEYDGAGSTQGDLQWAPAVRLNLTFATNPLTVRN